MAVGVSGCPAPPTYAAVAPTLHAAHRWPFGNTMSAVSQPGYVVVRRGAEQLAEAPPFVPEQVHDQGPEPATAEAVPAAQRLDDGAEVEAVPLADPQAPSTGVGVQASSARQRTENPFARRALLAGLTPRVGEISTLPACAPVAEAAQ